MLIHSSLQYHESPVYVWPICGKFMRYKIGCRFCYHANYERTLFESSLPWGRHAPIESTDLYRLTSLEALTIELCDWRFGLPADTMSLIREFLRNSPSLRTLILRIRLKPDAITTGQLPHAAANGDRGRRNLVRTIIMELANVRSCEVFENEKLSRNSWLATTLGGLPKAGSELRLTFDIRPPPPPRATVPPSNSN